MKFLIRFAAALIVASPAALAQSTSTELPDMEPASQISAEMPDFETAPTVASRGLRVSLVLPQLKLKTRADDGRDIDVASMERSFGISLGYAHLPIRRLGWTANATLMEITNLDDNRQEESITLGRIDANLAYAINQWFYIKAGGNVSGFTQSDMRESLDPWFGYQAALGFQITPRIGIEAGYITMAQQGDDAAGADLELLESGYDFSLTATF